MRLLVVLPMLLASPALAQKIVPPPVQSVATVLAEPVALMIAAFDRDADARVTRAEFQAGLKHSFDSVDPQHKGEVGYIAFADWAECWLGDRTALPSPFDVDADHNDRVTLDELRASFDGFFARFDKDKDGALTRAELLTFRTPGMNPAGPRSKKAERPERR